MVIEAKSNGTAYVFIQPIITGNIALIRHQFKFYRLSITLSAILNTSSHRMTISGLPFFAIFAISMIRCLFWCSSKSSTTVPFSQSSLSDKTPTSATAQWISVDVDKVKFWSPRENLRCCRRKFCFKRYPQALELLKGACLNDPSRALNGSG